MGRTNFSGLAAFCKMQFFHCLFRKLQLARFLLKSNNHTNRKKAMAFFLKLPIVPSCSLWCLPPGGNSSLLTHCLGSSPRSNDHASRRRACKVQCSRGRDVIVHFAIGQDAKAVAECIGFFFGKISARRASNVPTPRLLQFAIHPG